MGIASQNLQDSGNLRTEDLLLKIGLTAKKISVDLVAWLSRSKAFR